MQVTRFDIDGLALLKPARFGDHRGYFAETYSRRRFKELVGADVEFVQDNHSLSRDAGTLRGLHFQRPPTAQGKLVRVGAGAVLDVAVDLRHGSATFGRHVAVELTAEGGEQLWIPTGFAHAFCTLRPDTEFVYKVTDYYSPADDGGVIWNDPDLAIQWPFPADKLILSDKDVKLPRLADLPRIF